MKNLARLCAFLLVASGVAAASTIYDTNYSSTAKDGDEFSTLDTTTGIASAYANEFETPSAGLFTMYLEDVDIYVENPSGHSIDAVAYLYSNNSSAPHDNAPGTEVAELGSVALPPTADGTGLLEFDVPPLQIPLSATTQYWVVVIATNESGNVSYHGDWLETGTGDSYPNEPSGGVGGEYHGTGSLNLNGTTPVWTTTSLTTAAASVPEMQVDVGTPEPASLALMGGGLLALGFLARKRKKQASAR